MHSIVSGTKTRSMDGLGPSMTLSPTRMEATLAFQDAIIAPSCGIGLENFLDITAGDRQSALRNSPINHNSLVDEVLKHADTNPSEVALTWLKDDCTADNAFTWAELWHFSGVLSNQLITDYNLSRGDRVLIVYPFGIDFVIAFLACLRVGIIVVSVYPPDPARLSSDIPKLKHFVEDSQGTVALTTRKYATMVRYTGLKFTWPKNLRWVSTDSYPRSKTPQTPATFPLDVVPLGHEVALIQYTSGSTGNPKGVVITHGNLRHQLFCLSSFKMFKPKKAMGRYVGWTPQYHDMGLFNILTAIFTKTPAYMMSPIQFIQNPILWPRAIEKFKASWICGPNFAYALTCKRMQDQRLRFDASSVVFAGFGAEPTQPSTLDKVEEIMGINRQALKNMYGLAEHCVFAIGSMEGVVLDENRVSVGSIKESKELGIDVVVATEADHDDGNLVLVEEGQVGEIFLKSKSVAGGYWCKEELSRRTFQASITGTDSKVDGTFLRTGDLGYIKGDHLFISCRLKDLIIVNGRNVWPSDLETLAENAFSKEVRPGCSAAFQGSEEGAVLVCELRPEARQAELLVSKIRKTVETQCSVTVEQVVLVSKGSVPKTTSGKVSRSTTASMLRDGKLNHVAEIRSDGSPDLDSAKSLSQLLELSGVEEFSKTAAQNGLTSLQVMRLVNAAKNTLGIDLEYEILATEPASRLVELYADKRSKPVHRSVAVSSTPQGVGALPGQWTRILLQLSILLAQAISILVSAVPVVAVVETSFNAQSSLWLHRGRGGPLVVLSVVLWMAAYTFVCIIIKWIAVGRMRPCYLPLWSPRFAAWMLVERHLCLWEYFVGRFLLQTPWLNLVYFFLGADISFTSRLDTFFRCWDLVKIGSGCKVSGLLYPRVFDSYGVHLGCIQVGEGTQINSMAVVQGPARTEKNVEVESAAVVPPHSTLAPAGSRWHGNLCRLRDAVPAHLEGDLARESGGSLDVIMIQTASNHESLAGTLPSVPLSTESAPGHQPSDPDPWMMTRAALPVLYLAASMTAFLLSSGAIVPAVSPLAPAWSRSALGAALSYVATFLCSGGLLSIFVLILKWSFISPFLTDSFSALTLGTFFPFLDRCPTLVWVWLSLCGMHIGERSVIFFTWVCPPSAAHLVFIGKGCSIFSSVLAPRAPVSIWSYLMGKSQCSPWTESHDIVLEDSVHLYACGRVESGSRMKSQSQLATFSKVGKGVTVGEGTIMAGDPCFEMGNEAGSAARSGMSWMAQGLSLLLLGLHLAFVTAMLVVGLQIEKSLPGTSGNSSWAYLAPLVHTLFLIAWIMGGLLGEVILYKKVVLGKAKREEVKTDSFRALLIIHAALLWEQAVQPCHALFSGGCGLDCTLWLLGYHIDIGLVLMNSICTPLQDGELIHVEEGAIVDDMAYVSSHNVTSKGISQAPTRVGSGAVLHPLAGLFVSTIGEGASLYPRSKPLREVNIGSGECWAEAPAKRVERREVDTHCTESVSAGSSPAPFG